jgi:NAD(P)-dependent dehydrogenase (short-subunit alcohol dehydrogenase family)
MELTGAVTVVTGGGNGIGAALARRFAEEGAAGVVIGDLDGAAAATVAGAIGDRAAALEVDVSAEDDVRRLVALAEERFGPVDLFCSNAGLGGGGGVDAPDADWQRIWDVNVMAHVHAARAVLPSMLDRGQGWLLQTASAAGLLTNIGNAPYTVTKHAVVGFAEWLAITYGDRGIGVSCLCPMGVNTQLLMGDAAADDVAARSVLATSTMLEPDDVAGAVVEGLRDERFLILPHPEVADYWRHKADDPDRWLRGMRRLQARLAGDG